MISTPLLLIVMAPFAAAADQAAPPCLLWDSRAIFPAADDIPFLDNVRFSTIKKREPEIDGYDWLHGVALAWHKDTLFACWGHNRGLENTPTEVNQGRRSVDGGRSWSPVEMIAPHTATEGRSHGVFLSQGETLWLFLGRFGDDDQGRKYARLKTEALVLNEDSNAWESRGVVADLFWPCDEPSQLSNGDWIMGGMLIRPEIPQAFPAVAVSRGDDLTHWDTIEIPTPQDMRIWGETSILVDPDEILAIVRGGENLFDALVSTSRDLGRTWTTLRRSNLPMATSKPYAGKLSTGQRYLIGTMYRGCSYTRSPLTIAVSRPGEKTFCRIWKIRDKIRPEAGETADHQLAYPYAIEHDGYLYVGYSSSALGGNRNDAEMAVFPLSAVAVAESEQAKESENQ